MSTQKAQAIAHMRVAGYHGDRAKFTRLFIENRINMHDAQRAFAEGVNARKVGVRCTCAECAKEARNGS